MPGGAAGTGSGINAGSKASAILMVCFAAFGGILFGYDTGTISGIIAMPYWLRTFADYTTDPTSCSNAGFTAPCYTLATHDKSLIVSILSAGTFTGALVAYPVGDLLGRKWGLIVSAMIVFNLGVILQAASTEIPLFIVGRVIAGFGVGLVSCLVPMYQSEVSPRWIRGFVVGCYQWAITIGLLLAACVNQGTQNRDDSGSYRIPICIQFAWALILSGGLLTLPESPRFLIKKGRDAAARRSLARLLKVPEDDPAVEQEFQDIYANLQAELAIGATSYLDCFKMGKGKNLLRVQTGIWLQAMQQLTGINFIFYYGTTFFKQSGISNPFLITIATNVVNVGMTVPGILCIDRLGRRFMLFWGAVGMCVCEYLIAIVGVTSSSQSSQKVLIAFTCIYIAFFASTWGPIAWVVTGEIFPLAIRAKAMSMSTASNWLWNFGIGYATPYLVDGEPGDANLQVKVFFIWGSTCLLCILFTYFLIPETKGLSLEQVDLLYQNSTILGAKEYRKQLLMESRSRRPSAADIGVKNEFAPTKSHEEVYTEKADDAAHV